MKFGEDDVFLNLKSLSFCSITVSHTALEGFLFRHFTTLRSICLVDIQLVPSGIVQRLRSDMHMA
jgi:hypothetical protein